MFNRFIKANGRHRTIEGWPLVFTVLVTLSILVGTVVELAPILLVSSANKPLEGMEPWTPLELAGRDIYIREGCNNCHSQMVRPLLAEVIRYGPPGTAEETAYETPFLWGSKRTGPDLSRVGSKYPDLWHVRHMENPRSTSPNSIMPPYAWLLKNELDLSSLSRKLSGLRTLGLPYSDEEIANAESLAREQASTLAAGIVTQGGPDALADKEIIAIVAYLQRLGMDMKAATANQEAATSLNQP